MTARSIAPSAPVAVGVRRLKARPIARIEDVAPGKMIEFELDGAPALLVNDEGEFRAFLNICPHQGGQMTLEKENGSLRCQWHDGIWSLRGARISGPAAETVCLFEVEIFIEDGNIYAR